MRRAVSYALARGRSEGGAERAALLERLAARDGQLKQMAELVEKRERANEANQDRIEGLQAKAASLDSRVAELQTRLDAERKQAHEKLAAMERAEARFSETFKALSADALKSNNESFLALAHSALAKFQESAKGDLDGRQKAIGELVKPLKESLEKVDAKIIELDRARAETQGSVTAQLEAMAEVQLQLRTQTATLVNALRTPSVRGRWGEIQLQRVVEIAGMVEYCDFSQQESVETDEGRLRPDMVIKLPGGKNVVVDAKAPLKAYLEALEAADDDARRAKLSEHAAQVRGHLAKLGAKAYWDQFRPAPEFVVLFLPGETFFSAALEHDPGLIEAGVEQRVILATPTTLIALLKAVSYGWRQERIAVSAQEISQLGKTLYERLGKLAEHMARVGKGLGGAVESYNMAVGSFEQRVLVAARRFKELGAAAGDDIEALEPVEKVPRHVQGEQLALLESGKSGARATSKVTAGEAAAHRDRES